MSRQWHLLCMFHWFPSLTLFPWVPVQFNTFRPCPCRSNLYIKTVAIAPTHYCPPFPIVPILKATAKASPSDWLLTDAGTPFKSKCFIWYRSTQYSLVSLSLARHRCLSLYIWDQRTRFPEVQWCDKQGQTNLFLSTSPKEEKKNIKASGHLKHCFQTKYNTKKYKQGI